MNSSSNSRNSTIRDKNQKLVLSLSMSRYMLTAFTTISTIILTTSLINNLLKADHIIKESISQINIQEDYATTSSADWLLSSSSRQEQSQLSSSWKTTTITKNSTRRKKPESSKSSATIDNNSNNNINHKVQFFALDAKSYRRHNYYSGMWWTNKRNFIEMNVSQMKVLEGATFKLRPIYNWVMTVDWLDFCVEHISRLVKHMSYGFHDSDNNITTVTDSVNGDNDNNNNNDGGGKKDYDALKSILTGYIDKVTKQFHTAQNSATNETIAFIPMFESDVPIELENPITKKQRSNVLVMYSLAATLASLYQIGIGRVVIIGRTPNQPPIISTAFSIVNELQQQQQQQQQPTTLELSYVWGLDETLIQQKHIMLPKYAIQKMQSAMKGELPTSETKLILGSNPSRWKYVYFTEGDLVIHSRPTTLPSFKSQLDNGYHISAFRFQLMPHSIDFPDHQYKHRLIPNISPFTEFVDLDPHHGNNNNADACCDNGSTWPGLDAHGTCSGTFWVNCGTKNRPQYDITNASQAIYANRRLLPYAPMIRLKETGLGVPMIQNHGRTCRPAKIGTCTKKDKKKKRKK